MTWYEDLAYIYQRSTATKGKKKTGDPQINGWTKAYGGPGERVYHKDSDKGLVPIPKNMVSGC